MKSTLITITCYSIAIPFALLSRLAPVLLLVVDYLFRDMTQAIQAPVVPVVKAEAPTPVTPIRKTSTPRKRRASKASIKPITSPAVA